MPKPFKIKYNYWWQTPLWFFALSEQNIFMFVKYKKGARKFCGAIETP